MKSLAALRFCFRVYFFCVSRGDHRKMPECTTFIILLVFVVIARASADFCNNEPNMVGKLSCFVRPSASIGTKNFGIDTDRNEDVSTIDFLGNKNVSFLPIKVYQKFPNLRTYIAQRCNIGEIFQVNFENLFHVVILDLFSNNIETVRRDTFKHLVSVEGIFLSESVLMLRFSTN